MEQKARVDVCEELAPMVDTAIQIINPNIDDPMDINEIKRILKEVFCYDLFGVHSSYDKLIQSRWESFLKRGKVTIKRDDMQNRQKTFLKTLRSITPLMYTSYDRSSIEMRKTEAYYDQRADEGIEEFDDKRALDYLDYLKSFHRNITFFQFSPLIREITGLSEGTRHDAFAAIIKYIKKNHLTYKSRCGVECDEKLYAMFGHYMTFEKLFYIDKKYLTHKMTRNAKHSTLHTLSESLRAIIGFKIATETQIQTGIEEYIRRNPLYPSGPEMDEKVYYCDDKLTAVLGPCIAQNNTEIIDVKTILEMEKFKKRVLETGKAYKSDSYNITLYPLTPKLIELTGMEVATEIQVVQGFKRYIHKNRLLSTDSNNKYIINPDENIGDILGPSPSLDELTTMGMETFLHRTQIKKQDLTPKIGKIPGARSKYYLPQRLTDITGLKIGTKSQVMSGIMKYIEENNLFSTDPDRKTEICCDEKMEPIFGTSITLLRLKKMSMKRLLKLSPKMAPHKGSPGFGSLIYFLPPIVTDVTGLKEGTKDQVVSAIKKYIKENKLYSTDPGNSNVVICDEKITLLFGPNLTISRLEGLAMSPWLLGLKKKSTKG